MLFFRNIIVLVTMANLVGCYPLVTDYGGTPETNASHPLYEELLINTPEVKKTDRPETYTYDAYKTIPRKPDAVWVSNMSTKCPEFHNKACVRIALDSQILTKPEYKSKIDRFLTYPCVYASKTPAVDFSDQIPNSSQSFYRGGRIAENRYMRAYFGCDSSKVIQRKILVDIVKDLYKTQNFVGSWTEERRKFYRDSVLTTYMIIAINQPEEK